jgi:hypothetical protein
VAELKPLKGGYYLWKYVPSLPLSVIAIILWLTIGGFLTWKMWRTRTWFCTYLIMGTFSVYLPSLFRSCRTVNLQFS